VCNARRRISAEELKALDVETSKDIDLEEFVPRGELDPVYFNSPYYIHPDGPIAAEALRVIGAAMAEAGVVGIGRLTLSRAREPDARLRSQAASLPSPRPTIQPFRAEHRGTPCLRLFSANWMAQILSCSIISGAAGGFLQIATSPCQLPRTVCRFL